MYVNETDMTYVYTTFSTFHFQKNEGVNERVVEDVSEYLPKSAMKLRKFPHSCSEGVGGGRGLQFFTKKINLNLKCLTTKKVDKQK